MEKDREKFSIDDSTRSHPGWMRLKEQLEWYDRKSQWNQARYKKIKMVQVISAALIPFMAVFNFSVKSVPALSTTAITALLGVIITVCEGLQQLHQYSTLWIQYRATAESLKHEKFLFLSKAGPYRGKEEADALVLLAERVEELVSTEHAKWVRSSAHDKNSESEPAN